jgi:hypothetical protein
MKTITRSNLYLPMAAMILTAVLALPAAAQKQVPFKGALHGNDTDRGLNSEGQFLVATSGTGIGTLLGRFKFTLEIAINADGTDTGSAHFIASNGDTIDATFVGSGTVDGVVLSITEYYTITGGTGRFAGAQGSFIVERLADPNKFVTSGSFHGTITSPGAAQ